MICGQPVRGYQAAPLVMPFLKEGVPCLHAWPRCIVGWFREYVSDKWRKTSSSGVIDGVDA